MRAEDEHTIYLKDYVASPYLVEKVELDVRVDPGTSRVRALLTIAPREGTAPGTPLMLDGDELALQSIAIDGLPLALTAYDATPSSLIVHEPPNKRFVLETEVAIEPEKNTRLMGFYRSSGTWCTQCEPEGFRRITYFQDRPDNLAVFKVRMSWNRNTDRVRRFPLGVDPKSVDWKTFLGNTREQPFDEYRFRNWRWFWDFGGGLFTDLMVHWVDVAHWVLDLDHSHPEAAVSIGQHIAAKDVWETPDTVQTLLTYPGGVQMHFEGTFSNANKVAHIEFLGTVNPGPQNRINLIP